MGSEMCIRDSSISVSKSATRSTSYCLNGNPQSPTSIYCSSCSVSSNIGSYCSITDNYIEKEVKYAMTLGSYATDGSNFGVFTIPGSSSKITFFYQATDEDVDLFLQFKESANEVAGLMNYASGGGYKTISSDTVSYTHLTLPTIYSV